MKVDGWQYNQSHRTEKTKRLIIFKEKKCKICWYNIFNYVLFYKNNCYYTFSLYF